MASSPTPNTTKIASRRERSTGDAGQSTGRARRVLGCSRSTATTGKHNTGQGLLRADAGARRCAPGALAVPVHARLPCCSSPAVSDGGAHVARGRAVATRGCGVRLLLLLRARRGAGVYARCGGAATVRASEEQEGAQGQASRPAVLCLPTHPERLHRLPLHLFHGAVGALQGVRGNGVGVEAVGERRHSELGCQAYMAPAVSPAAAVSCGPGVLQGPA